MNLTSLYLYLLTLNDDQKAQVLNEQLYTNVVVGDYENAVTKTVVLDKGNGTVVQEMVDRLLDNNVNNVIEFAYKLWTCGDKEVITNRFPAQFRMILNEENVKIVNKKNGLTLKLAAAADAYHDRRALGDASDNSTSRVSWKMIPIWESNRVYFKILSTERNQYLKLAGLESLGGHREAWGGDGAYDDRHQWYLRPVKIDGEFLFIIYNRQYTQALKLDNEEDAVGDRLLWGYKGLVENPEEFGWQIVPF